jgi:hypothetical protein
VKGKSRDSSNFLKGIMGKFHSLRNSIFGVFYQQTNNCWIMVMLVHRETQNKVQIFNVYALVRCS